jgi:hypothetical protein
MGAESPVIKAAGSDGTTDYFSSNAVFAVVNVGGTAYFYTFDSKTLKYKTSTTSFQNGGSMQSNITTITADVLADGSKRLLVGTMGGYEVSTIDSNGKPANGETPSENAESAFGTRYVSGIWHYGAEGTLYAAVVGVEHSQYNKLWGYYKSRNKWNYE